MRKINFFLLTLFLVVSSKICCADEHTQQEWTQITSVAALEQFTNNRLVAFKNNSWGTLWGDAGKIFNSKLYQKKGIYFGVLYRSFGNDGYYLKRFSSISQEEFCRTKLMKPEYLASVSMLMRKATKEEYDELQEVFRQKAIHQSKKFSHIAIELPQILPPED